MTEEPPNPNTIIQSELYYGGNLSLYEWKRDLKRARKEFDEAKQHLSTLTERIERIQQYINHYEEKLKTQKKAKKP